MKKYYKHGEDCQIHAEPPMPLPCHSMRPVLRSLLSITSAQEVWLFLSWPVVWTEQQVVHYWSHFSGISSPALKHNNYHCLKVEEWWGEKGRNKITALYYKVTNNNLRSRVLLQFTFAHFYFGFPIFNPIAGKIKTLKKRAPCGLCTITHELHYAI